MKYFLDTEFLEGTQKKWFGQTKPTIDLISIGIVCEDGREYYAISKDFNLKEAWNRYDIKKEWYSIDESNQSTRDIKVYWLRENVLKSIFIELRAKEVEEYNKALRINVILDFPTYHFTYKSIKRLIDKYGKSNKQIAREIKEFCSVNELSGRGIIDRIEPKIPDTIDRNIEFYGYYSDYDWVVFCWLFGKMIDLPKGFPMYCVDLKQTLDEKENNKILMIDIATIPNNMTIQDYIAKYCKFKSLKEYPNYPKQTNEHNALADARWNYELYKFLKTL